jgi:hypothetical protein
MLKYLRGGIKVFIIRVGNYILIRAVPEQFVPLRGAEVWQLIGCSGNSSKPVIEDHVKLGSNGTGTQVEYQRNCRCMFLTHAHIYLAIRARCPARYLLAVSDSFVKDIDGASPHVMIGEFGVGPACASEKIVWA